MRRPSASALRWAENMITGVAGVAVLIMAVYLGLAAGGYPEALLVVGWFAVAFLVLVVAVVVLRIVASRAPGAASDIDTQMEWLDRHIDALVASGALSQGAVDTYVCDMTVEYLSDEMARARDMETSMSILAAYVASRGSASSQDPT